MDKFPGNTATYWIGLRHWAIALGGAVVLHAGVAGAVLWQEPPSGAQSAGTGGIEVSLGPIGGAPGSEARAVEEIPEADMVDTPVEPVPVPDTPPAVQAVEPPPEAVPEDIVETVDVVEVAEPIEMAEVKEVVEAKAEIPPPPPPKPPEPQRSQVVEPPKHESPLTESPPEVADSVEPVETQIASLPPTTSGSDGKAGTENSSEAGSAKSESGGGLPGSTADYIATLQAWLARHKEYPRSAQQRRQEGTALVYFIMDRDGNVIEHRLEQSSGFPLLDREAAAMIERAQPLPRMPDDMPQERLELVLPVQFFLRR